MTPKQVRFVKEYLIDLNAAQAAIRAGYKVSTARQQGQRLLTKADIKREVDKNMEERIERTEIDADYVMRRLVEIDRMDVSDILDDSGNVKPVTEWPPVWRSSISAMDVQEMMSGGDVAAIVKKIKWPDKLRNLELLGKHVGIGAFRERIEQDITATVTYEQRLADLVKRAEQ